MPALAQRQTLVSDFFTRRVVQIDLAGQAQTVLELPTMLTGLGWTGEGKLLVVVAWSNQLLRLEDNGLVEVTNLTGLVAYPSNDMVVDGQGRAYISNIGFNFGDPQATPQPGPILLVKPDGQAQIVAEGLAFPNGTVITPDGQTLIVAESYAARLSAFKLEADGSLSNR